MADPAKTNRLPIALIGGVTTAAITVAGVVVVGMVSLWRCGGFFGESLAVPGTLSEQLCRSSTGEVTFVIIVVAPLVAGLAGTAGAVGARDMRWLFPALAIAGTSRPPWRCSSSSAARCRRAWAPPRRSVAGGGRPTPAPREQRTRSGGCQPYAQIRSGAVLGLALHDT